ncbi:putative Rab-GTPase-TBC domain-containing protein [Dioscorea sansibarensis]
MTSAPIDPPLLEPSCLSRNTGAASRFSALRGVRWRISLGVLPGSPSVSVYELRLVTADARRRYATLRRRLLVGPHFSKDGSNSPDLTVDNPLSQNPDSMWGRYFRNAELEKMVEQDLSRLYPEHGSYFQTPVCQSMLRRILLMWCLRHPDYGYRQGMHELLAPLLYVLHVDVQHLSKVKKIYEDYFNDDFDNIPFSNGDSGSKHRFTKAANWDDGMENEDDVMEEFDPDTRDIFLLSDAYGAEGELGIVVSKRFIEHDAFCMFEGLMNGTNGVVAMVDFFAPSPATGANSGIPPVIEASSSMYHLLSLVDSSLHSHLVELGVEPQYFALRWLRVLFGREFSLQDLLLVWDEIFSSPNGMAVENNTEYNFKVLSAPRGVFISAMAVSLLLHLRPSLLATEYATSCLQKLLNFPQNIDVVKLIEKAKSLQALALETNISSRSKPAVFTRGHSFPLSSASPQTSPCLLHDGYWEEKWRVLNREEAINKGEGLVKGKMLQRLGLSRSESEPSPSRHVSGNNDSRFAVRRNLANDFSREIDSEKMECDGKGSTSSSKESISVEGDEEKQIVTEATCLNGENSSVFSTSTSPHSTHNYCEIDSERSSITTNSFVADNDEINRINDCPPSTSSTIKPGPNTADKTENRAATVKDRKPLTSKFHWFWRFGKGSVEDNSETQACEGKQALRNNASSTAVSGRMNTLKNLGQSMLDNIQVIESILQQDHGQVNTLDNLSNNILGSKGQATTVAALKELRKISSLISEM